MALSKSALKAKFVTGAIPTQTLFQTGKIPIQADFEILISKIPNSESTEGEITL